MVVLRAEDFVDDVAVVRQQDQSLGVLVEAADGKNALRMADEFHDIPFDVRFRGARDADRLVERDINLPSSCCRSASPSMRTSSPSLTRVPSAAGAPLHVTRPASIHLSASLREHTPVSLMYLLSRMEVMAGGSLSEYSAWPRA